ncbi:MAG TPA: TolC family protein [Oligoflexia bacterium]|nr:TolC family protein [Oligoflexia bacterium]
MLGNVLILVISSIAAAAGDRLVVRFEDLPRLLQFANGHVKGAGQKAEAADARTSFLLKSYLPTLKAEAGRERFETGPFKPQTQSYGSVEASVNLFRGGRDALESEARNAQRELADGEAKQTYLQELSDARKLYWQLVYQREVLSLLRSALSQNEKSRATAMKRIAGGLATQSDRLEFEISQIQFEQDIAKSELSIANEQRKLASLLGRPIDTVIETATFVPHDHDDSIGAESLQPERHPNVRVGRAIQTYFDAQSKQAGRWWLPSLEVYGTYALYTLRERDHFARKDRFDTAVGARLNMELFDGLRSASESKAHAFEARAGELSAAQSARELAAQFENAKQELLVTHQLIHDGERNVEKGQEYLRLTLAEYGRGSKNSPDVLSANQKYVDFKRRYAELRRDYQLVRAELMALLGK